MKILPTSSPTDDRKYIRRRIRRRTKANANLIISELTQKEVYKNPTLKNLKTSLTNLKKTSKIIKGTKQRRKIAFTPNQVFLA